MPHGIKRKSIRDPKSDVERQPSRVPELEQLMVEMTEEAISIKLDYEQSGSNMDSGSLIAIHHNSPLLQDENEELSDVAVNIQRKQK
jgi:hypothetical protein|tara:strand:- start:1092 stop:1352 length:261 start_codon:yes stop_codon:yes gene_type:complete